MPKYRILPDTVSGPLVEHETCKGEMLAEVAALKRQTGPGLTILGSGSIVSQLAQADLIDEYEILVNPVVLGRGKPCSRASERNWI